MGKKPKYPVTPYLDAARLMILPRLGRAKRTVNQLADRLGMPMSTLMGMLDTYGAFQVHVVPEFTKATEDNLLIELLCEDCGGEYVASAPGEAVDTVMLPKYVSLFAKLCQSVCKSLEDNKVSSGEAKQITRDGHALIRSVLGLIAEVERRSKTREG